jgi:hypothetical protein
MSLQEHLTCPLQEIYQIAGFQHAAAALNMLEIQTKSATANFFKPQHKYGHKNGHNKPRLTRTGCYQIFPFL